MYRYITLGESVDIKVMPMVFQSEPEVRRVKVDKRMCWFHDEVFLEHTNRYSYETCNTECRMRNYLETCGCIPFKYPRGTLYKSLGRCYFSDRDWKQRKSDYRSLVSKDEYWVDMGTLK